MIDADWNLVWVATSAFVGVVAHLLAFVTGHTALVAHGLVDNHRASLLWLGFSLFPAKFATWVLFPKG